MNESVGPRRERPPRQAGWWAWPLGLAFLGLFIPWALAAWFGFPGIGGADPGMWEAAALGSFQGHSSPVAPLFPALIALLVKLTGLGWARAGQTIAAVAFATLGPACFLLARRLGASPPLAALAGLLPLLEPWLALGALQCQPDSLSALAFVLAMVAASGWLDTRRWPWLLALVVVIGLLPQVREHAPPVALGLLVLLAVAPGAWGARAGRLGLGVVALALAPLLLGEPLGLPWEQHWVQLRWGEVVQHFFETGAPAFLAGTPQAFREEFMVAYARGDRLGVAWLHASLSFHSGWSPWLWLLPGLAGWLLMGRRRWVLFLGFLPLLAVPAGAQQPRHVAVLAPLAIACWIAALPRFRPPERLLLVVSSLALGLLCCFNLSRAAYDHMLHSELRGRLEDFAAELCLRTSPQAVAVGGNQRPLIYCDRRQADRSEIDNQGLPAFWIGPMPEQHPDDWQELKDVGWVVLRMQNDMYPVYQRVPPTR